MRVSDIAVVSHADGCELRAWVESEADLGGEEWFAPFPLWLRFPAWCRDYLNPDDGDPFLAALLVPAMTTGERLALPAPISSALRQALPEIQAIYARFDPRQRPIAVAAPAGDRRSPGEGSAAATGLFFSLGVDSFYSLLKNERDHSADADAITHLIAIHGIDPCYGAWDERFPPAILGNAQRAAAELGKTLIPVETNLRRAIDPLALWTMSHGAALASVALALGGLFRRVLVAATTTYDQLYPWGSHPVLDPLWSTETLRVVHDGCESDRIGKTRFIADSPLVLDTLRVCPGYTADYNCGRCVKCLPTMIDLLQLGVLDRCRTLPPTIDADALRHMLRNYRGHLNVEGFRRRHDAFAADTTHMAVRAALAEYLATEDAGATATPARPAAHGPLARWRRGRR